MRRKTVPIQRPDGKFAGSMSVSGRDTLPTSPTLTPADSDQVDAPVSVNADAVRPPVLDLDDALTPADLLLIAKRTGLAVATSIAAGTLVLLGGTGTAVAAPRTPSQDAVTTAAQATVVKSSKAQKCATLLNRLKKAHKKVTWAKTAQRQGLASKADVRKARTKASRVAAQAAKVCGVLPDGVTPAPPASTANEAKNAAVVARYGSADSAARTPADALALVHALSWTADSGYLDLFEAEADLVGKPLSAAKLAYCEGSNWCPMVSALFSPAPGLLVSLRTDPRNGDYIYSLATEYSDGWAAAVVGNIPLQVRTVPDPAYPHGVAHEVFMPNGQWFKLGQGWEGG